ncbi:MAG: class I SAM-dependent methyltransferase [Candidatus Alcyoniella australis]|nr:class I SAM-dependent methyltransferase [Candidatus Alcyoniella australis]
MSTANKRFTLIQRMLLTAFRRLLNLASRLLAPRKFLRLLLQIDNELYRRIGSTAVVAYDGLHPKHKHIRYHDFFVERIDEGQTVLDVGCGNGKLAFEIAQRAKATVIAIDISQRNIDLARSRYAHQRVRYVLADALSYRPDATVDVVVLSNVLEHIEQRVELLKRLHEITGTRCFLLRVPLYEREWMVPVKHELGLEWRLDLTHFTEYTVSSFEQELAAAGLTIVESQVRWGEIWASCRASD